MPTPDATWMFEFKEFTDLEINKLTPLDRNHHVSVEAWLKDTNYSAGLKRKMLKEYTTHEHPCDNKRYNDVGQFVKLERFPEFKLPRLINAKKNQYKCHFGPMVKEVEKEIYKMPEFIKHVPVKNRPAYIVSHLSGPSRKYLTSDFTSFEANISAHIMRWVENKMLRHFYKNHPLYPKMDWHCKSIEGAQVCKSRLGYTMEVDATRMSGEMSTSLSNGFTNLMIMKFVLHKFGVTDVRLVVEGDDALISVPDGVELPTVSDFAKLGLKVKLEVHDRLETASFCGLVFDPVDLINITDPVETILEMTMLTEKCWNMKPSKKMAYLKSKALSAKYQYDGCPMIDAFASWILRCTARYDARVALRNTDSWKKDMLAEATREKGEWKNRTQTPYRTRALVEELYNIPIAMQIALETRFDKETVLHPWFDSTFYNLCSSPTKLAWDVTVRPVPPRRPRDDVRDLPLPTAGPRTRHLSSPPQSLRHLFDAKITGWADVP